MTALSHYILRHTEADCWLVGPFSTEDAARHEVGRLVSNGADRSDIGYVQLPPGVAADLRIEAP